VAIVGTAFALALAGCGGNNADGGGNEPEVVSGVTIDESTPEAVAITYAKLIDTCEAEAAERAFALTLDPKALRAEAIEQLAFEILPDPGPSDSPSESDITPAVTQRAEERFRGQGMCDDPNQAPVATIRTRMLDTHPVDNTPLPVDTVLVTLDGETADCEGEPTAALAVTDVQGKPRVDIDLTVEIGDEDLLRDGCVEE